MRLFRSEWPFGWEAVVGQVAWGGAQLETELPPDRAVFAAFLGCLQEATEALEPGPVRVWGDSGLEATVAQFLSDHGFTIEDGARQVIDLGADLLSQPSRFMELCDESVIVCFVHPSRPPQSLDVYSTIHRYSHRVIFRAWGIRTLMDPAGVEVGKGEWILSDDSS